MVTNEYILNYVKEFCDFEDSEIYDSKLAKLINAEIGKLTNKGIPNEFLPNTPEADAYCLCIARAVLININPDIDVELQSALLLTETNELRCSLLLKPN